MRFSDDVKRRLHALGDLTIIDILASSEGGPFAFGITRRRGGPAGEAHAHPGRGAARRGAERDHHRARTRSASSPSRHPAHGATTAIRRRRRRRSFEIRGQRYVMPGDWARARGDGTIELLGRLSAVVNTGGEKVFPAEVEEALLEHPSVDDVVVFGLPDLRFGEVVSAMVSPAPGAAIDVADLLRFVDARLAGYKKPRHVFVRPSLERTSTGKVELARVKEDGRAENCRRRSDERHLVGHGPRRRSTRSTFTCTCRSTARVARPRRPRCREAIGHVFPEQRADPHRRSTAAYYRERNIGAVVFTVDATTNLEHAPNSIDDLVEGAERNADVLIPFGSVDPLQGEVAVEEARRQALELGVRGFKFHPSVQAFDPSAPEYIPLFATIEELGLPIIVHTGQTGAGAGLPGGWGFRLVTVEPDAARRRRGAASRSADHHGPPQRALAGRGPVRGDPQGQRLDRPLGLVAQVLLAGTGPRRPHLPQAQDAVRHGPAGPHSRPLAQGLRAPRVRPRGAGAHPQETTRSGCWGSQ